MFWIFLPRKMRFSAFLKGTILKKKIFLKSMILEKQLFLKVMILNE